MTSHGWACSFFIQWRMPALKRDKPCTHLHTQTVESNIAQVVQNNPGSQPRHICILLLSTQWNRGLSHTTRWQSEVSLDKRMHKMHMGRKGTPIWFWGLSSWFTELFIWGWHNDSSKWHPGRGEHNREASEKVRATMSASQTSKKKILQWKLRHRATDEWILCSFICGLLC